MVLMRAPHENDFYVLDMSVATTTDKKAQFFVSKTKATEKESIMWHHKMGHIHLRKMNFLVHNDLVEGVNLKSFHLNDDCIECKKGKQTKKSHPKKLLNSIRLPLERLHMALFGPVNVKSISGDLYCLVVTDDFTRFSWVMFLERKDETFDSLMKLFRKLENLYKLPIRRIRSDNDTEFKNNRYASPLKRVFVPSLGKIIQVQHVDCQQHTAPTQLPGNRLLFDYENLWESFHLSTEPNEEELAFLYQQQQSLSQEQVPRPLVVSSPTVGSNDHEAGPSGTIHVPPEETAPVFDQSDDSESETDPIYDEEPNIETSNADDHTGNQNITNLQLEVSVPDTVMPRTLSYHPSKQIIGDLQSGVEPKTYKESLTEEIWVYAMQEKLLQFEKLGVWRLVDLPADQKLIKTKWVFKCKRDDRGVIQAPRAWYETLSPHLLTNGFTRGTVDSTLFTKEVAGHLLIVQIYVDDIIFGSTNDELCKEFEKVMKKKFEMSSMGEMKFFLGLQVEQLPDGIFVHQKKYVNDVLDKFNMSESSPISTPLALNHGIDNVSDSVTTGHGEKVDETLYRSIIGSLMYLTASRPDIMYPTCLCARYQSGPRKSHMMIVKRILRYLKGYPSIGLWYPRSGDFSLTGYSNSDFGCCKLNAKSTTPGCQFFGTRLITWQCKKQTTVALSICEAEYVSASSCCSQILWIQQQMRDYGLQFLDTPIFVDNEAAINITKNPVQHSKTKHIEIRHHFIRDCYEKKLIRIDHIHTDDQRADFYTKAFDKTRFSYLLKLNGLKNLFSRRVVECVAEEDGDQK
ncbi:uncharacterized protein LOC118488881 [Helianthus annuus]|uniref:uncharacterized protein LOC118488881 n=1 Tax=Helianthus annuus TaxID=4232 RepID=UPI001652ED27|nr:uncharacterized protein LOC118488881 [Helianthus annuus]